MSGGGNLMQQGSITLYNKHTKDKEKWVIMEGDDHNDHDNTNTGSSSASSLEDSRTSDGSISSSSDMVDDACSSSTSYSSSSNSSGPLFELSELMAQLPIKRGLSKCYEGKSQSFTSLSKVMSIEDLVKKENPYRKKLKACKSYGGGLDTYKKTYTLPKATISKKVVSRGSLSSLSFPSRRGSFPGCNRPPTIPVQKNF